MEELKKEAKESFVFVILLLVFAFVLFVNPDNFIRIAINVLGYIGIFTGVILSFAYLIRKNNEANNLIKGILLILNGFIAILKADILENIFTILLCSYLLYQNVNRIKYAIILKDKQKKSWSYILELSVINVVLSFLILFKPLINMNLNTYLAVIIIIEEVIIIIENLIFLFIKKEKNI